MARRDSLVYARARRLDSQSVDEKLTRVLRRRLKYSGYELDFLFVGWTLRFAAIACCSQSSGSAGQSSCSFF